MLDSWSSVPDSGFAQRNVKLRSSCESCGNAKVRCDRGKPKCARCVELGNTCVYGISRRFGKAQRKRLHPCLDLLNATVKPESSKRPTAMVSQPPPNIDKSAQLRIPTAAVDVHLGSSKITTTTGIPDPSIPGLGLTPFSLEEWPQFDIWDPSIELPPVGVPGSGLQSINDPDANVGSAESHSCPRGSYELFRDQICPSPFLHAPTTKANTVSAGLDEVLQFNCNAMERLRQLLECSCAKSGHRIMVHASIISRILIWYQQAAEWTGSDHIDTQCSRSASNASQPVGSASVSSCPSSAHTPETETDSMDMASSPSLVQSTGFAVAPVPISVGAFHILDENVQDTFRNQLLLSELKKLGNVIDFFTAQNSDATSAVLYSHLGTWLRSEHSRTMTMLRARLDALNKVLET